MSVASMGAFRHTLFRRIWLIPTMSSHPTIRTRLCITGQTKESDNKQQRRDFVGARGPTRSSGSCGRFEATRANMIQSETQRVKRGVSEKRLARAGADLPHSLKCLSNAISELQRT